MRRAATRIHPSCLSLPSGRGLLPMQESNGFAEVIEVEPVIDTLVHRGLLRLDLGVRHLHERKGGVLVEDHRDPALSGALVYDRGFVPAAIDLGLHLRSRGNPGQPIPTTDDSEKAEDDLLVLELDISPPLGLEYTEGVVDDRLDFLLPQLLLFSELAQLLLLEPLVDLVSLRLPSNAAFLRGGVVKGLGARVLKCGTLSGGFVLGRVLAHEHLPQELDQV